MNVLVRVCLVLVFGSSCAVCAPQRMGTDGHDLSIEPVANVQGVTLTARAPEELVSQIVNKQQPTPASSQDKDTSSATASVDAAAMIHTEERWYTRAQLLSACGMAHCNDTEHCWGNPGGYLDITDSSVKPDGSHHEYCCVFCDSPHDPVFDPTKLVDVTHQCGAARNNPAELGWCVGGDDTGGLSGPERCQAHGGYVAWNYHHGKLHQGSKPDGKCLSLLGAKTSFHSTCVSPPTQDLAGREACVIGGGGATTATSTNTSTSTSTSTECCGHGSCVWRAGRGWGCEFEAGFDVSMCYATGSLTPASTSSVLAQIGELLGLLSKLRSTLVGVQSSLSTNPPPNTWSGAKLLNDTMATITSLSSSMGLGYRTMNTLFPNLPSSEAAAKTLMVQANSFNTPQQDSAVPPVGDMDKAGGV